MTNQSSRIVHTHLKKEIERGLILVTCDCDVIYSPAINHGDSDWDVTEDYDISFLDKDGSFCSDLTEECLDIYSLPLGAPLDVHSLVEEIGLDALGRELEMKAIEDYWE